MVFSDLFFLFVFLPAFLLSYLAATWIDRRWLSDEGIRSNRAKNWVLVCFSLIFYAWGEPVYVFLMLFCVLVNYLVGLGIAGSEKYRKAVLVIGLILNICILGTFKYLGFLAQCLCDMGIEVARPNIALPIGISFYTFQSISYLIDVYRRESPVQRRFPDLLLYICGSGRDHADVDGDRLAGSQPGDLPVPEHPKQAGLQPRAHEFYAVEEQGAAVRHLDQPGPSRGAAAVARLIEKADLPPGQQ